MTGPLRGSAEDSRSSMDEDGFRRDLRRYANQTSIRLVAGMLILLFIVGNGLIFLIYGEGAVRTSLLCMLAFFVPVFLIVLLLALFGWIAKRGHHE
ncbi:MAG: hypothetical protein ACK2T2_03880 [Anaerolineales bacterium]